MSSDKAFELRAGMQLMPSLLLRSDDIEALRGGLTETVARAPAMFRSAPVAVDLQWLREADNIPDFDALGGALRDAGMVPVGVRNAGPQQQAAARAAGWALLPEARETAPRGEAREAESEPAHEPARVVTQPVRSGQQVYAASDLVLLAPVSPGAEVLADGCIHVYAPLRGRALAGVRGDEQARIFCQALQAELVSVAGRYRTLDDLDPQLHGKATQIRLDGEHLIIEPL